ncbi:MAG: 30S ribosomal protein S9 [Pseudomonadota bacterium]
MNDVANASTDFSLAPKNNDGESAQHVTDIKKMTSENVTDDIATKDTHAQSESGSQNKAIVRERVVDDLGRSYATGKRKGAIARVWVKAGKGEFKINGRLLKDYLGRAVLRMIVKQPLVFLERDSQMDVMCTVKGGGLSGQAGAIRLGVAKAISFFEPDLRPQLRKNGYLTRDSRVVERKKYGRRKARRSFQFSKR